MTEAEASKRIQLAAPSVGCRLFRNTTGRLRDNRGKMIAFGLAKGSSDLIGWYQHGAVAVFLAVEVKSAIGRLRPEQQQFLEVVNQSGGIGILARSVHDFTAAIAEWERTHD